MNFHTKVCCIYLIILTLASWIHIGYTWSQSKPKGGYEIPTQPGANGPAGVRYDK